MPVSRKSNNKQCLKVLRHTLSESVRNVSRLIKQYFKGCLEFLRGVQESSWKNWEKIFILRSRS